MYLRKLNQDEQSVLGRLVELCCEAYWQEAKSCRIFYEQEQLNFIANINSNWSVIEKEELSLDDYAAIMQTLQGIFEPADTAKAAEANAEKQPEGAIKTEGGNRVVTVTLDERSERPLMNLLLDFNGEKTDPAKQVLELTIEDLIYNEDEETETEDNEVLDTTYLN